MDDRAVLVLDQIHHLAIAIASSSPTTTIRSGAIREGLRASDSHVPDVAGLVPVVEVDLQVDHNCAAAHGAHLLPYRSGTYLGCPGLVQAKSFSSSSSGGRAPPGGRNRTVQ